MKSGFVAIIGKPNVGKSTFLNQVMGFKLAIMSPKPQTTRNPILGIYTSDAGQIVFVDTPGIYKSQNKLGDLMQKMSYNAMVGVDLVLYMISEYDSLSSEDTKILEAIKNQNVKTFLIVNKIDLIKKEKTFRERVEEFKNAYPFDATFGISAQDGTNVSNLLEDIFNALPEGDLIYPEEEITNKSEKFIIAEYIRERIFHLTEDEVPHSCMVEIEQMEYKKGLCNIKACIIVKKESHKPIIIGKGGSMIKRIGQESREEIEKFLNMKCFLELFVKVEENWTDRDYYLKDFGFKDEIE